MRVHVVLQDLDELTEQAKASTGEGPGEPQVGAGGAGDVRAVLSQDVRARGRRAGRCRSRSRELSRRTSSAILRTTDRRSRAPRAAAPARRMISALVMGASFPHLVLKGQN